MRIRRQVLTNRRTGFTLAELLVAMAILGILAAITFPVVRLGMDAAKRSACINNYSQTAIALGLYTNDYDDWVPPVNYRYVDLNNPDMDRTWVQTLLPYVGDFRVFQCPADSGRGPDSVRRAPTGGEPWTEYYAASLKSNLGYNYLYFSPLVGLSTGEWRSYPISMSRVADKSGTLIFLDSVWDRTQAGNPYGGGSWVVVPPCRYKNVGGGQQLDTFELPQGTQYYFGFQPVGWQPESSRSWLVYGGAWPWHRSRFNVLYADGRAESVKLSRLTAGCNFRSGWQGRISSSEEYLWDLDSQ